MPRESFINSKADMAWWSKAADIMSVTRLCGECLAAHTVTGETDMEVRLSTPTTPLPCCQRSLTYGHTKLGIWTIGGE